MSTATEYSTSHYYSYQFKFKAMETMQVATVNVGTRFCTRRRSSQKLISTTRGLPCIAKQLQPRSCWTFSISAMLCLPWL